MGNQTQARVNRVTTPAQATELAAYLTGKDRTHPVVVISTAAGAIQPYVDAEAVAEQVGDLAQVYVLISGAPSLALSDGLPPMTQVYGGASRVYPVDLGWMGNPYRSALRFAYDAKQGAKARDLLVDDALTAANAAGLRLRPGRAEVRTAWGVVRGIVGGRALVDVEGGNQLPATVQPGQICDGVPIDRLVVPQMRVWGLLDVAHNRFDLAEMALPAGEALAGYRVGDLVPARVHAVQRGHAHLDLLPGFPVVVQAADVVAPGVDVRFLLTVGETVAVQILTAGAGDPKGWRLEVRQDAEPGELREAAAFLPGGPPWLGPPGPPAEQVAAEPEPTPVAPQPPPIPRPRVGTTDPLTDENAQLRAEIASLREELGRRSAELSGLRHTLLTVTTRAEKATRELRSVRADTYSRFETRFADPVEQFRFDVHQSWVYRTTADEKAQLPLPQYRIGPDFLSSWGAVADGVSRAKVVDVVTDVLLGRAWQAPGREAHQLRQGPGGGDPTVQGPRGETCWRISLQVNSPSARRLHVWLHPDGSIELSSVRLHDDFRP